MTTPPGNPPRDPDPHGTGDGPADAAAALPTAADGAEPVLVLAPSVGRAAGWTLVGAIAIGSAGWTAGRTTGSVALLAASLLLASVALTVPFALQTFAPRSWTLRVAKGRLWGHAAALPVDVALEDVTGHRVARLLGDHALRLQVGRRRRWVLLPVGADVGALRQLLAEVGSRSSGDRGPRR